MLHTARCHHLLLVKIATKIKNTIAIRLTLKILSVSIVEYPIKKPPSQAMTTSITMH